MGKLLFLILFIIATSPLLFAEEVTDGEHINRGINYFSDEDYKSAITAFERSLSINPQNPEAYKWLGMSYLRLGENPVTTFPELLEKAVDSFNKALILGQNSAEVHYNLGITYLALNRTDAAEIEYVILKNLDRDMADTLLLKIDSSKPQKVYTELGGIESTIQDVKIIGNQVLVPVTLTHNNETIEALLLLDTGASVTVIHTNIAKSLNIDFDEAQYSIGQVVGGGLLESKRIKLDFIKVGPHIKEDFDVAIIEHQGPDVLFDGLLGMNFLNDFPYQVDFNRKILNWVP